jgi:ribosomal protein L20
MARVKRGTIKNKQRRETLKRVKGYRLGRSTKKRSAYTAIAHAGNHAFNDRRKKKGVFRALWNVRLNAALRPLGTTYSRFIDMMKKKDIELNRKVLSEIAAENPMVFARIVSEVTGEKVEAVATEAPTATKKEVKKEVPKTKKESAKKSGADDLTKVEGIGPKIASIFTEAGIATFADLAKANIDDLRKLLEENKLASHDPTTWGEQAELANDGKWDELKKWQDEMDGGKA